MTQVFLIFAYDGVHNASVIDDDFILIDDRNNFIVDNK